MSRFEAETLSEIAFRLHLFSRYFIAQALNLPVDHPDVDEIANADVENGDCRRLVSALADGVETRRREHQEQIELVAAELRAQRRSTDEIIDWVADLTRLRIRSLTGAMQLAQQASINQTEVKIFWDLRPRKAGTDDSFITAEADLTYAHLGSHISSKSGIWFRSDTFDRLCSDGMLAILGAPESVHLRSLEHNYSTAGGPDGISQVIATRFRILPRLEDLGTMLQSAESRWNDLRERSRTGEG